MTGLQLFTKRKSDNYDMILIIINCLTKIVYYKLVKVTINTPRLAKIIIDVMLQYYSLYDSIINDCKVILMSKFWSLLCYFLSIKKRLSIMFYSQINGQTKQQNSKIETYFYAFIN